MVTAVSSSRTGANSLITTLTSIFWIMAKARHHKRRVVQTETLRHFHRVLLPGGMIHLVTDHADLWQWYQDRVEESSNLFDVRPFEPRAPRGRTSSGNQLRAVPDKAVLSTP